MNKSNEENSKVNLLYVSDKIRRHHIEKAMESQIDLLTQINEKSLLDTWDGPDDLTVVINRGDHLLYKEGWVAGCWQSLYEKPDYKHLTKVDAVEKFISERMKKIADSLSLKIKSHVFKRNILTIVLTFNF